MQYVLHLHKDGSRLVVNEAGRACSEKDAAYRAWLANGNAPEVIVVPSDTPDEVPLWTVHAALREFGLFEQVDAAVSSVEATKPAVFAAWTMGNYAVRHSTLIVDLAQALSISDDVIDAVFTRASQIAQG